MYWQSEKASLIDRTSYILNNELFSDVRFFVGPTKTEYPAHKLLLCLASPVFEQRFNEHLSDVVMKVQVPDISPRAFYKMLKYIYTDVLEIEDLNEANDVLAAAEKFKIEHLELLCKKYKEQRDILPQNACRMYEIATKLHLPEVIKLCRYTFRKHTDVVLNSASFMSAELQTVEAVVMNDVLNCDEIFVMEAVTKWGVLQCYKKGIHPTGINIRTCIDPLLKHLRFLTLSSEEFYEFLSRNDIFTRNEIFAITMKLSQPGNTICARFPSTLCQYTSKRNQSTASPLKKPNKKYDGENDKSFAYANKESEKKVLHMSKEITKDTLWTNVPSEISIPSLNRDAVLWDNVPSERNVLHLKKDTSLWTSVPSERNIPLWCKETVKGASYMNMQPEKSILHLSKEAIEAVSHMNMNPKKNFPHLNKEARKTVQVENDISCFNNHAQRDTTDTNKKEKESSVFVHSKNDVKSNTMYNQEVDYLTDSESKSSDSDTENEDFTQAISRKNSECRSCEIILDSTEQIPKGLQTEDVYSNVQINMNSGSINIIGLHIKIKELAGDLEKSVTVVVTVTKDLRSYEEIHNEKVEEDINIFLDKKLPLMAQESCKITILIESLQLQCCSICKRDKVFLTDQDISFNVLVTGNKRSGKNKELLCFIKHILYTRVD